MPRWSTRCASIVVFAVMAPLAALASDPELIVSFDEASFELPEGIAVDKRGNLFVSLGFLGLVQKIPAGSTTPEPFGAIPGFIFSPATDFGVLGLAVDAPGNVYAAVQGFTNAAANGVWRFDRKTGAASKIPGTGDIVFPNDLAFDKRGNLYITDSALGAIWRLSTTGDLEVWLQDDLLEPTGALGLNVGANGIEYFRGSLYVAVLEQQTVVEVPVLRGGAAGAPEVIADISTVTAPNPFPPAPDGLAIDVHGNIWIAGVGIQAILVLRPDGSVEIAALGDPYDYPSSLAFGTGRGEKQTLFSVNFSTGELFGDATLRAGPGVVALDAGVPGNPLP